MRNKLLVVAAAVGALAVTAGVALAVTGDDGATPANGVTPLATTSSTDDSPSTGSTSTSGSDTAPVPDGQLTGDLAAQLVTERYGGTVTEVERELEHGQLEWKIEIQTAQGELDVRVDAATGQITRVDGDDRGGDDDGGNSGRGDDDSDDSGYDDHGGR